MNFDPGLTQEIDRIMAQYIQIHDELEQLWRTQIVFTWHWWLNLALTVLPWALWLIVRDRKRQHSLFYAALFVMLISVLLDTVGVSQNGWAYNSHLLPFFPQYLPWDLTVFPVTAMFFYQVFAKINPWLKGVVFAALAAYVVEPVFVLLGIYEPAGWEYHYSLPIYFAIYMIGYFLYAHSFRADNKHGIVKEGKTP